MKDNVELICSISEISSLFKSGGNIPDFLKRTVMILSEHMKTDVCSIYLYDENTDILTLEATEGLSQKSIGFVKMKLGQGITGKALEDYSIIRESNASANTNFLPFPDTNEEKYEAFLAVPIHKGKLRIGVIVLQHSKPGYFTKHDGKALKAIAAQLASLIENARLLLLIRENEGKEKNTSVPKLIKGQKAKEGIAIGPCKTIDLDNWSSAVSEDSCGTGNTIEEFQTALNKTMEEIEELQNMLSYQYADVASLIFSSHLLMLQDSEFSGKMSDLISSGLTAKNAVIEVVEEYITIFKNSQNSRVQEKVTDVKDLGHKILRNLGGNCQLLDEYKDKILIARELWPSEMLKVAAQGIKGLIMLGTGATAHLAILARSLHIPVIYCDDEQILNIVEDTIIIIDAYQENIFISPDENIKEQYMQTKKTHANDIKRALPETKTACGQNIVLQANINILSDLKTAVKNHAEGIGLYRSEFPFLIRNDFPSEEEQTRVYSKLFEAMPEKEVTLRTLDIGGDKILSYLQPGNESNPFLGLRAIRFSLRNQDIFKTQLRAMLRSGFGQKSRIMFPLVSSLDDFLDAKAILYTCIDELKNEDTDFQENPCIGAMVELPSIIEVIDEVSKNADFLCIGTNDLIQYLLGVDRTNKDISELYVAHHPSVFRAINRVIKTCLKNSCDISICGEISSDPHFLQFVIGAGIRKISIDPHEIPDMQDIISSKNISEMTTFSQKLLSFGSLKEINTFLGL